MSWRVVPIVFVIAGMLATSLMLALRSFGAKSRWERASREAIVSVPPTAPRERSVADRQVAGESLEISGRVVDAEGRAVAGGRVHVRYLELGRPAGPPGLSDARGRFVVVPHTPGLFSLTARSGAGVAVRHRVVAGSTDVLLRLGTGPRLRVRVVDAATEAPLPAASLRAKDQHGAAAPPLVSHSGAEWLLSGVVAGRAVAFVASHDGYVPAGDIWVPLTDAETLKTLKLSPGAEMSLRLVRRDGTSVDVPRLACSQGSRQVHARRARVGEYRVSGLDPRRRLSVVTNACDPFRSLSRHDVSPEGIIELTVDAPGSLSVRGVAPGFRPRATREGLAYEAGRDADGTWRFDDLEPGPVQIAFLREGEIANDFATSVRSVIPAGGAEEIVAPALGAVALEGIAERPKEYVGELEVELRSGARVARARVQDNGRFSLSGVPSMGRATLTVHSVDGSYLLQVERTLPFDPRVVIRPPGGGDAVRGKVSDRHGNPLAGARVDLHARAAGAVLRRSVHADRSGQFVFEDALDATFDLVVRYPGMQRVRRGAVPADVDLEITLTPRG